MKVKRRVASAFEHYAEPVDKNAQVIAVVIFMLPDLLVDVSSGQRAVGIGYE